MGAKTRINMVRRSEVKRILLVVLLVAVCAPGFSQMFEVDGRQIYFSDVVLIASQTTSLSVTSGTFNLLTMPEDYDLNGEWSGATFTASVDETVVFDLYFNGFTGSGAGKVYGYYKYKTGGQQAFCATNYIYGESYGETAKGRVIIKMLAGETLSFWVYPMVQAPSPTISNYRLYATKIK